MADSGAPQWLTDAVLSGLQRLVALRLADAPALDTIKLTGAAWVDALATEVDRDNPEGEAERIRDGFALLMRQRATWPAPKHLILAMSPRRRRWPRALPGAANAALPRGAGDPETP